MTSASNRPADTGPALDADVVIIGSGPVGSALAVDLGLAGVRTIVLEQRENGQRPHPGTNLTNVRSMEHMRRWGATEHLRASNPLGPQFVRDVVFPTRVVDGQIVARVPGAFDFHENLPFASALPHFGPQESIERGLRARLAELPTAEIRYASTFERFVEHEDFVEVVYRGYDGAEGKVACSYLVGCDGGASAVRRQLGIRMEGIRGLVDATIWYVFSPEIRDLIAEHLGGAVFCWFVNEDKTGVNLLAQNDDGLYQFFDCPIEEGVDGSDWEEMKARLIRTVGRDVQVEPVEGGGFKINSVVAPEFHRGRVFLAGESAHHISVFGGFGMNTGIGDAADLGWKLAAAVHGWAGPELLSSYSAERIPVVKWVRDLTEWSTQHVANTWTQAGDGGAWSRRRCSPRADREGDPGREERGADELRCAVRCRLLRLADHRIRRDRAPAASFGEFTPSASPGARAPHMWLGDGTAVFDHVALQGFTLLRLNSDVDTQAFEDAAANRGIPFSVQTLRADGLSELYEAPLVLVRPDHYVAWRGTAVPDDPGAVLDVLRGEDPKRPGAPKEHAAASA